MTHRGKHEGWLHALACTRAFAAALLAGAAATLMVAGPAAGAEPLRVCADPDNLPFSKAEGPERGLYVELAELVGKQLGMPVEYTWWYTHNQRRALRNTVAVNACDTVFALPSDYRARALTPSEPFLDVGYAVVATPGFVLRSLDDLRGKRIGVQFSSTPHIVLNTLDGFQTLTHKTTDELFDALAKGEIDVAFIWGPVAGYENKTRHAGRWKVTSVSGHDFAGRVSVAVRRENTALAKSINEALAALKPQIDQLAAKYGFPRDKPVNLALAAAAAAPHALVVPSGAWRLVSDSKATAPAGGKSPTAQKPAAKAAAKAAVAVVAPVAAAAPLDPVADAGRVKFNDACSHCHGQDGYSPVRERDLRRLKIRYDGKWPDTALTTIRNGRSADGMPAWKDILKQPEVEQLMAFLHTIQK